MKYALLFVLLAAVLAGAVHADTGTNPQTGITLLNSDPSPVRAGASADFRFRIDNEGPNTENVEVQLLNSYPFTPASQATQNFTLGPYSTYNNYVNLEMTSLVDKTAVDGTYDLKLRYRINGGAWIGQSYSVQVTNKAFAQISSVSQAELAPGVITPLNFTITNVGDAPLQNLVFSWSDANSYVLPVHSDSTKYIKYLDVGQSATVSYDVVADVNAPAGLDKLSLSLSYESTNNATTNVLSATSGVLIGGQTDFDVSYSESSGGQTSLSVANTGNNPAYAVKVSVPPQPGFTTSGSTSSIIGNLNKGDYTLVTFSLSERGSNLSGGNTTDRAQRFAAFNRSGSFAARNDSAQTQHDLTVDIEYTDTTGVRRTVVKQIPVQASASSFASAAGTGTAGNFRSSRSSTPLYANPLFIVVVLVLIGGGIFWYRRRKARKR